MDNFPSLKTFQAIFDSLVKFHIILPKFQITSVDFHGWGLGAFLRWWLPSTMWAGPLIYFWPPRGCLNNPIFSNLGLCAACWARLMCHHELWPTSVSHPFSSLKSSLGFFGGKHCQKITLPIFRLVLQNLRYSMLLSLYSFLSLSFLLTFFRLVCYCSLWPRCPLSPERQLNLITHSLCGLPQ